MSRLRDRQTIDDTLQVNSVLKPRTNTPEMRSSDMPMIIFGLDEQRKCISNSVIETFGNIFDLQSTVIRNVTYLFRSKSRRNLEMLGRRIRRHIWAFNAFRFAN